jgi:pimeloyl-ACP methyl ester carboxylesterase
MEMRRRQGVGLAYTDSGDQPESLPIIFVHGWGCDHTSFAPQIEFFGRSHRVITVDLRGHGESDAPHQDYTMAGFAEDMAWLCTEIGLGKSVVVGHSMGGNVALEMAAHHSESVHSVIMIDSVLFPHQALLDALAPMIKALEGSGFADAYRHGIEALCLPTDEPLPKAQLVSSLPQAPQHVLIAALRDQLFGHDIRSAAAGCRLPIAYLGAAAQLADLARFSSLTPQLVIAKTLGAGHFSYVFVPDQVNTMIERFIVLYSKRS